MLLMQPERANQMEKKSTYLGKDSFCRNITKEENLLWGEKKVFLILKYSG